MTTDAVPTAADAAADDSGDAEQVAFDISAFPGGARGAVEAVLMVVDEPVTVTALASALQLPEADVEALVLDLEREYDEAARGFALRNIAGGWRIYSRPDYAPVVERFVLEGQVSRLTQASLETLAVVAYRQPISRGRISAVRGVNVDGVVRTLVNRGLVEETGTDPETGAVLYGTTGYFLQRLGLQSLDDLPALAPFLPEVDVLDELAEHGRG